MSFADDIKRFAEKTGQKAEQSSVAILSHLNYLVVKRTPVDKGRARGGWVASLGSVSLSGGRVDKSGDSTISRANAVAAKAPGSVYYLTNAVSYIHILEYGGYPASVKHGTWNKKKKAYEIRSSGGYSLQAPSGMLRISIDEIKQEVTRIIENGY